MGFPELLADVRQLDPRVHQDAVPVASFDQLPQIFVARGVGVVEMPRRRMQRADAGRAPAFREIVGIGARAVRVVEKRPQPGSPERRPKAEIRQRLHEVRKAFVAVGARIGGNPENGSLAELVARLDGRAGPAFLCEDMRGRRNLVARKVDSLAPDHRQRRVVFVDDVYGRHGRAARRKSEAGGERRRSFEDDSGAVPYFCAPVGRCGRIQRRDVDIGRCVSGKRMAGRSQDGGPGGEISRGHGKGSGKTAWGEQKQPRQGARNSVGQAVSPAVVRKARLIS